MAIWAATNKHKVREMRMFMRMCVLTAGLSLCDIVYYAEMMKAKGAEFISIICDGAYVNPTSIIGKGSLISRWSIVSDNVQIGDFVMIHGYTTLGHDVKIKDYSSIESYCFFGGYSELGEESIMHVRSNLTPHKKVGKNAVVGSGSVVIRNVPDGQHVHGNPAKKIEY